MFWLQRLRSDHAASVFDFEAANRNYFAESVSDRGDDFFEEFDERFQDLLAHQDAGICVYHVLVDRDDSVVGRFNLYDLERGSATVGYRVAERAAGRGLATSTLRRLCQLAGTQYGIEVLTAAVKDENVASRRVLEKAGFVLIGPTQVAGHQGTLHRFTADPAFARAARVGDR